MYYNDYYVVPQMLPKSCKEFMYNVTYSSISYENCEDIFKFHQSRMGFCFLANNLMHGPPQLVFNMSSPDFLLQFFLITDSLWDYVVGERNYIKSRKLILNP